MNSRFVIIICVFFSCVLSCTKLQEEKGNSDPVAVFNELWNLMDQRYALFSVKDTSWKELYDYYSKSINSTTSEVELFNKLSEMLRGLKDGHVVLMSPSDTTGYDQFYTVFPRNFNYNNIAQNYLNNDYRAIGPVIYKVAGQIGYLYYSSFGRGLTDSELSVIFREMSSVKGLIVDVRNNTGGSTINAENLAKIFMSERKLVKYELIKKGPGHNDFFDPQPFYLAPAATSFNKPIIVLTNRTCYSACNDFVLYLLELANVRLVGDQTGGGGGIPNDYILSNGWRIRYTASLTLSSLRQPVEAGIQPDIFVLIGSLDEAAGKDPILEKAIQLLQ